MKKMKLSMVVLSATMLVTVRSLQASIVNPGFESGFTGWTLNEPTLSSVVSSHAAVPNGAPIYTAQEGSFFARLATGGGAGVYTTLSQLVSLDAGEVISGWAAFDAGDYLPFNDNALATVSLSGTTTLFSSSVAAVGNYGETPWTPWSFTAPTAGDYLLEYKVANIGDNGLPSYALFDTDANAITAVVPEPSTYFAGLLLLPFGLRGVRQLRNRQLRNRKLVA